MKLHITNINGFNASKELLDAQTKISKVGIELGAYEMGIYTYPVDSDSDVELSKRLDGIISALGFGDIVVLQLPTLNGYKYDSLLLAKILAYRTKLIIYIHGECLDSSYLNLLKRADSIIVNKNVNYHFLKNHGFCSVFLDSNYGHTKKCLMDAIERLCFVENTLLCMRNRVIENEIQVGFGLYDKTGDYTSWVGVTIQSILEHTNSKVCFHILHDSTLSNANKIKLIEIVEKFDDRIQFYSLSDDLFEEYNAQMGNYTVGAMFRVMLPKILGDLNRIIYLDADLLFNRDIQELWDIDINDYCLAAVPDLNVKKGYIWTYPTRGKVIEKFKYFNSGVLYMNLENIRKKGDLHTQTIEYLKEHPESDLPDQDALNVIYKDDTLLLVQENIEHSVLNANNAFWEAEIIKEAGQKNVVTVATSMAGRGTDIHLGPGVKELGGLCVLGIGRMSNTRDERQARGRAGRQGEPGVSIFYTSLEDDVCTILGEDFLEKYIEKDKYISKRRIKRLINKAQKIKDESAVFQRKNSVDYDSVMKRQRTIMYKTRNDLLDGKSLDENVLIQIYKQNIDDYVKENKKMDDKTMYRYILDNLSYRLKELSISSTNKKDYLKQYADMAFKDKKQVLGNRFSEYCRLCTLKALDDGWIEEVDYLQQLQAAISGRSTAQRNLLYEYQREARLSFRDMEKSIKKAMIRNILLGEVSFGKDNEMIILYP